MIDIKRVILIALNSKAFRFLLVGGTATLLQFAMLVSLIEFFAFDKVFASGLSYALSSAANYLLNYHLTFGSAQSHWHTLPKFILVACFGIVMNTLSFALALWLTDLYLLAQVFAVAITLVCNYLLHKYWIYRRG